MYMSTSTIIVHTVFEFRAVPVGVLLLSIVSREPSSKTDSITLFNETIMGRIPTVQYGTVYSTCSSKFLRVNDRKNEDAIVPRHLYLKHLLHCLHLTSTRWNTLLERIADGISHQYIVENLFM